MNQLQSRIRTFVVIVFACVGIVPWIALYPRLGADVVFEQTDTPLDIQVPIFVEVPVRVIELDKMVIRSNLISMVRKPKSQTQYRCRWHDEEAGIRVCESGKQIVYPTL